jgi:hypothetical protein
VLGGKCALSYNSRDKCQKSGPALRAPWSERYDRPESDLRLDDVPNANLRLRFTGIYLDVYHHCLLRSRKTSAIVKPGAVRYSEVAAGYHRWMAPAISYVTRPLSPETWDDFAHLVEANNGVWGGCWCMGFHPEGVGKGHTIAGNRLAKQAHVRNETVHQILVYDGDECVGWRRWAQSTMLEVGSSRPTPSKARGAPLSAAPISIRARPTSSRSSASSETG